MDAAAPETRCVVASRRERKTPLRREHKVWTQSAPC